MEREAILTYLLAGIRAAFLTICTKKIKIIRLGVGLGFCLYVFPFHFPLVCRAVFRVTWDNTKSQTIGRLSFLGRSQYRSQIVEQQNKDSVALQMTSFVMSLHLSPLHVYSICRSYIN
jgi:hypothetical protein